jgi:hypothetical protein
MGNAPGRTPHRQSDTSSHVPRFPSPLPPISSPVSGVPYSGLLKPSLCGFSRSLPSSAELPPVAVCQIETQCPIRTL